MDITNIFRDVQIKEELMEPCNTVEDWAGRLRAGTVLGCVIRNCTVPWGASDWRGKRARGRIAAVDRRGTAEAGSDTPTSLQSRTAALENPGNKNKTEEEDLPKSLLRNKNHDGHHNSDSPRLSVDKYVAGCFSSSTKIPKPNPIILWKFNDGIHQNNFIYQNRNLCLLSCFQQNNTRLVLFLTLVISPLKFGVFGLIIN